MEGLRNIIAFPHFFMVTLIFPTSYSLSLSLNVFTLPQTLVALLYTMAHTALEISDLDYYLLTSLLYLLIQSLTFYSLLLWYH